MNHYGCIDGWVATQLSDQTTLSVESKETNESWELLWVQNGYIELTV